MYKKPSFLEQAIGIAFIAALLVLVVILITGALSFITGLVFYFTWNHGAVKFINGSLGGTVSGVSYWTSFFVTWFIGFVATLLKGSQVNTTTS